MAAEKAGRHHRWGSTAATQEPLYYRRAERARHRDVNRYCLSVSTSSLASSLAAAGGDVIVAY